MSKVYVAVVMDKYLEQFAVSALLQVAAHCGKLGYYQILFPSARVDVNRNNIVKAFLSASTEDDDALVMLDSDHAHPADIVERLVGHNVGVVGALAFTRSVPYMPCCFLHLNGAFRPFADWTVQGLVPCDAVGTGAIAIRRSVFRQLDEADPEGTGGFYFQCAYPASMDTPTPSEDMWFATACLLAGIPHHVDTSLVTPHLMTAAVDESYFRAYQQDQRVGEGVK